MTRDEVIFETLKCDPIWSCGAMVTISWPGQLRTANSSSFEMLCRIIWVGSTSARLWFDISNDVNKTNDLKNKNRAKKGGTNVPAGNRKRNS